MAKPAHRVTPPLRTVCAIISSSLLSRLIEPKRKLEGLSKTLDLLPLAYWSPWTLSLGSESPGGAPAPARTLSSGSLTQALFTGPGHAPVGRGGPEADLCPSLPLAVQKPCALKRRASIPWDSLLPKLGLKGQEV